MTKYHQQQFKIVLFKLATYNLMRVDSLLYPAVYHMDRW